MPALRRRGLALGLHFGGVIGHQLLADLARRELPVRNLRDRRHFRRIQVYLAAVPADSTLVCFAVAAPGLESLVGDELQRMQAAASAA